MIEIIIHREQKVQETSKMIFLHSSFYYMCVALAYIIDTYFDIEHLWRTHVHSQIQSVIISNRSHISGQRLVVILKPLHFRIQQVGCYLSRQNAAQFPTHLP